jgi:hypothetical protein
MDGAQPLALDRMTTVMKVNRTLAAALVAGAAMASSGRAESARDEFDPQDRAHWAFQPVTRPAPPPVKHTAWVRNPIDAFIVAALEARGIEPGPSADRITLIRRAYLDLIGLPPTPAEVDAFLADKSPKAFEKVVERLLASPHYGERWARHWLDLARYAESEGFKADETRPHAWRYRDYVIRAFNADKPYDRFVREQIAGDELWPDDPDARVATAFNRHYPDESNARNLRQRRQEILNDITDTVGAVFVGMTYACARCHDHKYEPILQSDYYRLQAFFANTAARDDLALAGAEEQRRHREKLAAWEEATRDIRAQIDAIEAPKRRELERDYFEKYPPEIQAAWNKPEAERTPFEKQMVWKARQYLDPKSHEYVGDSEAVATKLKGDAKAQWQELRAELKKFASLHPGELPIGIGMADLGSDAPPTHVLSKGVYDKPKEEVPPGFLQILDPAPAKIAPPKGLTSTGRRTALANLLTAPANPLTARVMVNRVWQHHLGRGLVGTASDFGLKGDRPTHPELLDWLASEFIAHGWSLKYLHRLIMTSAAYQQSSAWRAAAAQADPENKLLWRFARQRLEGEVIRDSALAVAGLLNPKMGGPGVFPELPAGMPTPRGGWKVNADAGERNRRSVYVFVRRNTRYPLFESFDMPDPHESCPRRNLTTSPLQALHLLNSQQSLEWAQSFAGRVLESAGNSFEQQIETAFRLACSRKPDKAERTLARDFFRAHRELLRERTAGGQDLALPPKLPPKAEPLHAATLVDFCHMLLNAHEFVYRN